MGSSCSSKTSVSGHRQPVPGLGRLTLDDVVGCPLVSVTLENCLSIVVDIMYFGW